MGKVIMGKAMKSEEIMTPVRQQQYLEKLLGKLYNFHYYNHRFKQAMSLEPSGSAGVSEVRKLHGEIKKYLRHKQIPSFYTASGVFLTAIYDLYIDGRDANGIKEYGLIRRAEDILGLKNRELVADIKHPGLFSIVDVTNRRGRKAQMDDDDINGKTLSMSARVC
jgi:hypothetical protein